jgi:hypothetical protein
MQHRINEDPAAPPRTLITPAISPAHAIAAAGSFVILLTAAVADWGPTTKPREQVHGCA